MVITEVEGVVPMYRSMTETLEPQLDRTYLLQDTGDPMRWRVATVWMASSDSPPRDERASRDGQAQLLRLAD